jgi:hypothetical protein
VEVKTLTTAINQVADSTGAVVLLNGMSQGTTASTRVGRQVVIRDVEYSLAFYATPTTGIDQIDRFLLVFDRQSNGSAPTITDILESNSPFALLNKDTSSRFVVIVDNVKSVNASAEPESNVLTGHVTRRVNKLVQFNAGNAGTIADINTGGMFLVSLGNLAAGATAGSIIGRVRVAYTDA